MCIQKLHDRPNDFYATESEEANIGPILFVSKRLCIYITKINVSFGTDCKVNWGKNR